MTLEAGTPIGKYVIKRKLAEGGMAEIYLATSTGPEGFEKEVVIKRVRPFLSGDEGFVRMFIAEARLASRLNHANLVQIFDFDKHEDSYYLAMEYVRGCSLWELRKRCREKGIAMPPVLVAHIGAQVAAGLHYAHRLKGADGEPMGLVHRDVTPHNVLLSFDGAVKLTDFGIAKAGHTKSGMLKGKFAYMAPEQARGEEVDARTDVFALGIVLWEMLTGGKLFDGDTDIAVLRAVKESAIAPPARLNPDVPEELDEVVCIALERDPGARHQSAGALERALAQCVLRLARSVDDTDVGTFVRKVLDVPLTQFIQVPAALMDRAQRSRSGSTPATGSGAVKRGPVLHAPTARLPSAGSGSGRSKSVRTSPPEESLASASTLVLPRDPELDEEPRSASSPAPLEVPDTPVLPSVRKDSRPVPVASREERGSTPKPEAPIRVAQVMPAVGSTQEEAPAKRGGKGLWGSVSVGALVLIGGAAALVLPSKPEGTVAVTPPPSGSPVTGAPDTGAVAVVTPPPEPPPAQTEVPPQKPPEQVPAPAAEARGTLIVVANPYADVYLDNKLLKKEVQGRAVFSVASGSHLLTFKHPASSEEQRFTVEPSGKVTKTFRVRR